MRDGAPSHTARQVAAYRLEFERLPAPFGDPDSDDRLAGDVAAGADTDRDERMARYLRGRTLFFDRVVLNGLDRGVRQVVAVGAGYDGRALRYAKTGVRWFEIDHPSTQNDKRRRLDRLQITTAHITYLATDLGGGDLAAALTGAGFEPDGPSLLLCEGVAVYLTPAVLARVMAQLRSIATAGTRLALSTRMPAADPTRRKAFETRVAELGEPLALGDADVEQLLTTAHWQTAELSERAQRIGLIVATPTWAPGRPATRSRIGAYLERTFHRDATERLAEHLNNTYATRVTGTRRLDAGVIQVARADGPPWVARIFPADRPSEATGADADTLAYLAHLGYPAERLAHPEPVSHLAAQAVLVTELVEGRPAQPSVAVHRRLGELLGRLHTLPAPPARPGGGWHHLTLDGGPTQEITALRALLDARTHVPDHWREALQALRDEVDSLDDLHDLPAAFTHPDFVAANTILDPTGSPVIVDWTGAGYAPRLWTLGFLLWSAGRSGPRHIDAVAAGYRTHVQLEPAELDRLAPAIAARPLVFESWAYATGRRPLLDVATQRPQTRAVAHEIAARARTALLGNAPNSQGESEELER